jgi:cardiolipin synthase
LSSESEQGASQADVTVAVTGTAWIGRGVGSVSTALEQLLERAENEVQIVVYELTGGAEEFLDLLTTRLARGIVVTMIVNRLDEKPTQVREGLEKLSRQFPQFHLFKFSPSNRSEDLHAKIIVRDRREALVGSANLTWNGLTQNHELAVLVSGPSASVIGGLIDALSRDERVLRVI